MEDKIQLTLNSNNTLSILCSNSKYMKNGFIRTVETKNNNINNIEIVNSFKDLINEYKLNSINIWISITNKNNNMELWNIQKNEIVGFDENVINESTVKIKLNIKNNNKIISIYNSIKNIFNSDKIGFGEGESVLDESIKYMNNQNDKSMHTQMEKDVNSFLSNLFE